MTCLKGDKCTFLHADSKPDGHTYRKPSPPRGKGNRRKVRPRPTQLFMASLGQMAMAAATISTITAPTVTSSLTVDRTLGTASSAAPTGNGRASPGAVANDRHPRRPASSFWPLWRDGAKLPHPTLRANGSTSTPRPSSPSAERVCARACGGWQWFAGEGGRKLSKQADGNRCSGDRGHPGVARRTRLFWCTWMRRSCFRHAEHQCCQCLHPMPPGHCPQRQ